MSFHENITSGGPSPEFGMMTVLGKVAGRVYATCGDKKKTAQTIHEPLANATYKKLTISYWGPGEAHREELLNT